MRILVTGGAGYLGAVLVPKLLAAGHTVTVFDILLFGPKPLATCAGPNFTLERGDIRDTRAVDAVLARGFDVVIHLAAISNDPSSDLDPELTTAVNRDALQHLMPAAKAAGVGRFLYASSASVYGIKADPDVTEDLPLEPITLYARFKAEGEQILNGLLDDSFCGCHVRAATVCGMSPRLRLDLTINILTTHAVSQGRIRVFGGEQLRPNVHIEDLTDFYVFLLDAPREAIQGQAFNVCRENASVMQLAQMIQAQVDSELPIEIVPSDDTRSYHLSSEKASDVLGWNATHTLSEAVADLQLAIVSGRVVDVNAAHHRNVVWMKQHPDFFA